MNNNRITTIIGAGAVLDLELPSDAIWPSTENITNAILGIRKKNVLTGQEIVEIKEIYEILEKEYPCKPNFELIFHVLEMFVAYGWVWQHPTMLHKVTSMFPVFAPFTSPKWLFDVSNIKQALDAVLLTIMDIVNGYNAPYLAGKTHNQWYRSFWKDYNGAWDVFNLNYDTTIEHTLTDCEDGFDNIEGQPEFQHFVPQKLWEHKRGCSTMSHLHGCIEFFNDRYKKEVYNKEFIKYGFHDLYKYPSYDKVRSMFMGSSGSMPSNQAGEQFINTPIITGLMKTDKLNILPFDFYHGHLYNCVVKNNSLLIVGYSFGDLYINQLLERMELIHGANKRIVMIDCWKLMIEDDVIDELVDTEKKSRCVRDCMVQKSYDFSNALGMFLCRMTGEATFDNAVCSFKSFDRTGPMISQNGCLMLFIGGFKAASVYKKEIYEFLNS